MSFPDDGRYRRLPIEPAIDHACAPGGPMGLAARLCASLQEHTKS